MCGVIAFFDRSRSTDCKAAILRGLQSMAPRGPDAVELIQTPTFTVGHCRLAIIDLDKRSNQPMKSRCGRYLISYNGEIYNFAEIREELTAKGTRFSTNSDTEVLLALFEADGEEMLRKLRGMFAFVIFDLLENVAFLARDPYGIKPLYYSNTDGGFLVASQVKALIATGLVSREPCPRGQAGYWMLGSVPEPYTWYRDIRALPAGSYLWVRAGLACAQRRWFDISNAWLNDHDNSTYLSKPKIRESLIHSLRESVESHLVSDVPIGVFLSGGIDSGSIAASMAESGERQVEAVTIQFEEYAGRLDDEVPMASALAKLYNIRHTIRCISRAEFLADLPRIIDSMDQPTIDGVNTWFASKAVAELGLKVAMSGVGGDELFQGYSHFRLLPRVLMTRKLASRINGMEAIIKFLGRIQEQRSGNRRWHYLSDWSRSIEGAWWLRRSIHTPDQLPEVMGRELAQEALRDFDVIDQVRLMAGDLSGDPVLAISQIESTIYLRNQLLRDSDWASMAHSLELRTPFVDSFLLNQAKPYLPYLYKFPGKSLLADLPKRRLPYALVHRKKTGFSIPISSWLSSKGGDLVSWQARVAKYFS